MSLPLQLGTHFSCKVAAGASISRLREHNDHQNSVSILSAQTMVSKQNINSVFSRFLTQIRLDKNGKLLCRFMSIYSNLSRQGCFWLTIRHEKHPWHFNQEKALIFILGELRLPSSCNEKSGFENERQKNLSPLVGIPYFSYLFDLTNAKYKRRTAFLIVRWLETKLPGKICHDKRRVLSLILSQVS